MKVLVEGRGLTSGGGLTGALRLLPAMARQGRHQYVAFLPHLPEYAALDCPNLRVVLSPTSRNVMMREWWLNVRLRKALPRREGGRAALPGKFCASLPAVPAVIRLQNAHYVYRDRLRAVGLRFAKS